jgi:class 3 adenylate cyclase
MEENIAIMMADLSGYTALTETHGPSSAADLIDKYMEIVETCLVGRQQICGTHG